MSYYNQIKELLINNEVNKKVKDYSKNKSELDNYFNVGKLLIRAQGGEARAKYGNKMIKEYALKLTNELGKGYSVTNLKYMRQFYLSVKKGQHYADQLSWSHYQVLLPLKNIDIINYYISIVINQQLTRDELREKVKLKEYERLDNNTKKKIINNENLTLKENIKNPIIIKSNIGKNKISEKMLKKLILEDISSFMKELGEGFSFIDSEYKIKLGDRYNYIDLLLYNILYNCYVVIELKVTELKSEHIGQITKYRNYIDKNLKSANQNKTIGIIIVKKNNKFVLEYSSDKRIVTREYELI